MRKVYGIKPAIAVVAHDNDVHVASLETITFDEGKMTVTVIGIARHEAQALRAALDAILEPREDDR